SAVRPKFETHEPPHSSAARVLVAEALGLKPRAPVRPHHHAIAPIHADSPHNPLSAVRVQPFHRLRAIPRHRLRGLRRICCVHSWLQSLSQSYQASANASFDGSEWFSYFGGNLRMR